MGTRSACEQRDYCPNHPPQICVPRGLGQAREKICTEHSNQCAHPEVPTGTITLPLPPPPLCAACQRWERSGRHEGRRPQFCTVGHACHSHPAPPPPPPPPPSPPQLTSPTKLRHTADMTPGVPRRDTPAFMEHSIHFIHHTQDPRRSQIVISMTLLSRCPRYWKQIETC